MNIPLYLILDNFLMYSGDDDKTEEKSKHRSRQMQLEGGSNSDDNVFSSVPFAQWRNFYGFTYLDLSGE